MALVESKQQLTKGDQAPPFSLPGIDNNTHSLDTLKGAKALLIIFMCNHCPYVIAKFDTIKQLQEGFKDKGLVIVGINPNDATHYPEDSFENMKKTAQQEHFNFMYLYDEHQEIAKAYGAVCTPDPFLFNENQQLVYHGRIDNAMSPSATATQHDMQEVIEQLLNNKPVTKKFLPSRGCSIKWKV